MQLQQQIFSAEVNKISQIWLSKAALTIQISSYKSLCVTLQSGICLNSTKQYD